MTPAQTIRNQINGINPTSLLTLFTPRYRQLYRIVFIPKDTREARRTAHYQYRNKCKQEGTKRIGSRY